ncbi:hypothetical protein F3Y22_tig00006753pilonHSYRG00036 [Hibiscus syriacus]|uniref:Uncharacterized protein n=1 Tax=Hibiscus syriacus TaxID=106335 RepID=A0A6A3CCG6_HIBSY|nr:hypothetical protein F3Y22_tig00006753pilonHSYRG00036 [Hibiscus syriacus]
MWRACASKRAFRIGVLCAILTPVAKVMAKRLKHTQNDTNEEHVVINSRLCADLPTHEYHIETGPDCFLSLDNGFGWKLTSTGCLVPGSGLGVVSPRWSSFLIDSVYAFETSELNPGSISFFIAFVRRFHWGSRLIGLARKVPTNPTA